MKKIVLCMVALLTLGMTAFAQGKGNKVLVAYFSATGTTERVAGMIAEATGGTLYEIEPTTAYTDADLNWRDDSSRSNKELDNPLSRPDVKSPKINIGDYEIVYLGFPIWRYITPRIINTFLECYDFTGKTVIPFATSGGSGISQAEKYLHETYPKIRWGKGKLLNNATKESIKRWINE